MSNPETFLAIYAPPWLDPATEDPPRNFQEYADAVARWEETLEGGGLWDPDQE